MGRQTIAESPKNSLAEKRGINFDQWADQEILHYSNMAH